ncbi:MAG: adenylosuccinate synthetase [Chloroflexi bacterium]|nr:adenylosuccinate synthetase [Chloroflexota bacterium]
MLANRYGKVYWVFDLQQGDGGKGAIVDSLASSASVTMRCQGGDNAGHTSIFGVDGGFRKLELRLLPSGLRHPHIVGVIAGGVLVNLEVLRSEIQEIGLHLENRLRISDRCHVILPLHRRLDRQREDQLSIRGNQLGTTRRGIGPASVSKVARIGLRMCDLNSKATIEDIIAQNVDFFNLESSTVKENLEWVDRYRESLLPYVDDTDHLLDAILESNGSVVIEGAQGSLIDIENGTYPYVTSTITQQASVSAGGGISFDKVTYRIGVLKIYQTMVGEGPFVTEATTDEASALRHAGGEFEHSDVLSRPRRCGWMDLVSAKWAVDINSCSGVILTKLDVISALKSFKVCVAYRNDVSNEVTADYSPRILDWDSMVPMYLEFKSWRIEDLQVESFEALPSYVLDFIEFIEQYLCVPVVGVRIGPTDVDMIVRKGYL